MTVSWTGVSQRMRAIAERPHVLDDGQRRTLRWIADRLVNQGAVLADEVGTGKTRIACALAEAVLAEGGRVAMVVPPGLMHQWNHEWQKLRPESLPKVPKAISTFTSYVRGIVENAGPGADSLHQAITGGFPRAEEPEMWLVSHSLRAPLVRVHRGGEYRHRKWQLALPGLVHAAVGLKGCERHDGRSRMGRLKRGLLELREGHDGAAWTVVETMADVLAARTDPDGAIACMLAELPPLDVRLGGNNLSLAEAYRKGGPAQRAFERLLGEFLGEFDLIVIDEAHKSRHGPDADEARHQPRANVLTRLLSEVLRMSKDARRLGMTATPLELSGADWEPLLQRALRGSPAIDVQVAASQAAKAAQGLAHEAGRVAAALSVGTRATLSALAVDALCSAAENMVKSLRPHLTRRRRTDDRLHFRFQQAVAGSAAKELTFARSHRRVQKEPIRVLANSAEDSSSSLWVRVLFAMESLGNAMRGYFSRLEPAGEAHELVDRSLHTAYTRLSGGHLHDEYLQELRQFVDQLPEATGPGLSRQRDRIRYWLEEQQGALNDLCTLQEKHGTASADPLWSHPRVVHAVRVVERFTMQGEKVLVFGTYRAPLRALTEALDLRHALRRLQAGMPVARFLGNAGLHAWHQLEQMRAEGFDPTRHMASSRTELEAKWKKAHHQYENLRKRVKSKVEDATQEWLGGHRIDVEAVPRSIRSRLAGLAVPFVLDAILYDSGADAESLDSDQAVRSALRALWSDTLEPALEEERDRDDAMGDSISEAILLARVVDQLEEDESKSHDTHHARELNGETGNKTRQLLQAKFNRRFAAPHVLVAQSRVGREGLNLHKSCRVVVQFNAEWNPAILEQQVGRVDRKGSRWERLASEWLDGDRREPPPFIEIVQLVFEGTYDDFQWDTVYSRQHLFDATLYGEMLPAAKLANLDEATQARLIRAAPDFRPPE